ncbi:acyl-CoA carboxylase subunit epsilon [Corynebacterium uropygiale]|uniref:Acyl-CoA carboxylase subunit epsilon n=1 Tax=Corynebacterium uropygiale TaxID=1775911 RepID=A0A9X1TZS3_9CORY|nr:acyl-CoA carboxylase subunit epsilon [Corynebacterium uropygiale]MCF4006034.1 acyl-CoA carboxylase subunit epsilon [Corynebacterium uropygiale]
MSDAPLFRIIKGNPSDTEVAALTAVITQKMNEAALRAKNNRSAEQNLWGCLDERLERHGRFNPAAFNTAALR